MISWLPFRKRTHEKHDFRAGSKIQNFEFTQGFNKTVHFDERNLSDGKTNEKMEARSFAAAYADLTKFGIVVFVLLVGLAGYLSSLNVEQGFGWFRLAVFMLGLYCCSSGSLAFNQIQESKKDAKMPRTQNRPLVSGEMSHSFAISLAGSLLVSGLVLLFWISEISGLLGLITVVLYNGFYTVWWKPRWIFAAVPGALPGALPVTMGYAANSDQIFSADSIYLFLILFLWQMPHFWSLALKYEQDYQKADVPVLPVKLGVERTFFHMGLYTFVYAAVALAAPWFVHVGFVHLFLVVPFAYWVLWQFFHLQKNQKRWIHFFLWTNLSVLVFVFVPVIERWILISQ